MSDGRGIAWRSPVISPGICGGRVSNDSSIERTPGMPSFQTVCMAVTNRLTSSAGCGDRSGEDSVISCVPGLVSVFATIISLYTLAMQTPARKMSMLPGIRGT